MGINSYIIFFDRVMHYGLYLPKRQGKMGGISGISAGKKQAHGSPQDHNQVTGGCDRVPLHQALVRERAFVPEYIPEFFPHAIAVSAPGCCVLHRLMTRYHTIAVFVHCLRGHGGGGAKVIAGDHFKEILFLFSCHISGEP